MSRQFGSVSVSVDVAEVLDGLDAGDLYEICKKRAIAEIADHAEQWADSINGLRRAARDGDWGHFEVLLLRLATIAQVEPDSIVGAFK